MNETPPTLYKWAGGIDALKKLTDCFYAKVALDPLIGPVFKDMGPDHPDHVARFIAEVFGGPTDYSDRIGSHARMMRHHLDRHLTEAMRRRWIGLIQDAAEEVGLANDPEFRSAFMAYLEWGTRIAVETSKGGATVEDGTPMPKWGWGEVGGPYQP